MSNIRPIADPSLAAAMVATFQSIDDARSAPRGMSATRWRILKCIAKAAPNVPSPGELRLCSGLSKAALAEHLQALRWKGLVEMDGYRLSPSAAEMVGLENPYPPKEAKVVRDANRPDWHDRFEKAHNRAFAVVARDEDGRPVKLKEVSLLDPADVPACMRPDCTAPERPVEESRDALLARKSVESRSADRSVDGRRRSGGRSGRASTKDVAPRRVHRTAEATRPDRIERHTAASIEAVRPAATENLAASRTQISSPPAEPPKPTNWIEQRHQRIAGAIAFLKSQAILVSVVDRDAPVRTYRASGKKYSLLAEEVVELAIEKGWSE